MPLRSAVHVPLVVLLLSLLSPALAFADGDDFWSAGFALPSLNSEVGAVTLWNGTVVLGGKFTRAGKLAAPYIVAWSGTAWEALGSGLGARVSALGVHGGDLYAATYQTSPPTVVPAGIWRWNGTSWSAVGTLSQYGTVYTMTSHAGALFVGGSFTAVDAVSAANVARWDGTSWSALASGTNGAVNALTSHAGLLFAGGTFTIAGGVFASAIAHWNGASWGPLGAGVWWYPSGPPSVSALLSDPAGLIVGGYFNRAGSAEANNFARWTGVTWEAMNAPSCGSGRFLTHFGSDLVAYAMCLPGGGIARYDGSAWSSLQDSLGAPLGGLAVTNGALWAAGSFGRIGGKYALYFGAWNGSSWSAPAPWEPGMAGISSYVYDLAEWNGRLIAAGSFSSAGAHDHYVEARGLAAWDGTAWQPLGAGLDGYGWDLSVWQGNLVVAGRFRSAGGITSNGIARWDGASWSGFGPGFSYEGILPYPWAVTPYGPDLVVVGEFTDAGSTPVDGAARWDGSAWQPLGSGFSIETDYPLAAVADGGDLYVGGYFDSAGGVPANNVARWDGSAWHPLGVGVGGGLVEALVMHEGELVAGGEFQTAGGAPAVGAARWDGNSWRAMSSNVLTIKDFAHHDGTLYAAGRFLLAGGGTYVGAARWNGQSWNPLGSGASLGSAPNSPWAFCLASFAEDLYLGGAFDFCGGKPSVNIARWTGSSVVGVRATPPASLALAPPVPNPSSGGTLLVFTLARRGRVRLAVADVSGRRVATLLDALRGPGRHEVLWNGRGPAGRSAPGVYFVRLETPEGVVSRKLARVR